MTILAGARSEFPRRLAASQPALVRSRIRPRSNFRDARKYGHDQLARVSRRVRPGLRQ
jgi:hypothetical protein